MNMRDWAAIITYTALNLWLQVRLAQHFSWWMIPVTVLAYLLTDVLVAHLHWLADTYGDLDTHPLREFIYPFRQHHVEEMAITTHDFVVANGSSALVVIPIVLVSCLIAPYHALFATLLSGIAGFSVLSNQLHKWAHEEHTGVIRWLQSTKIILSPEMHKLHHPEPIGYFATTSGLSNHVLTPRYWRWLESVIPWKVQRET